jgi:hypothetical protein
MLNLICARHCSGRIERGEAKTRRNDSRFQLRDFKFMKPRPRVSALNFPYPTREPRGVAARPGAAGFNLKHTPAPPVSTRITASGRARPNPALARRARVE